MSGGGKDSPLSFDDVHESVRALFQSASGDNIRAAILRELMFVEERDETEARATTERCIRTLDKALGMGKPAWDLIDGELAAPLVQLACVTVRMGDDDFPAEYELAYAMYVAAWSQYFGERLFGNKLGDLCFLGLWETFMRDNEVRCEWHPSVYSVAESVDSAEVHAAPCFPGPAPPPYADWTAYFKKGLDARESRSILRGFNLMHRQALTKHTFSYVNARDPERCHRRPTKAWFFGEERPTPPPRTPSSSESHASEPGVSKAVKSEEPAVEVHATEPTTESTTTPVPEQPVRVKDFATETMRQKLARLARKK